MEKITHELAAIYILWLRQIKRFLRSKPRMFMSIFQPMLFLFAFGFGFGNIYQQAGQGNYIQFLIPGIIAMSVLFSAMFSGIEVISDKQFGFLKETLVAPISRFSIIIGRTLGGATTAMIQGVLVMLVSLVFGLHISSVFALVFALFFMFCIALTFTAFGTSLATFFNDMHAFPIIINVIVMPLFFLSGALFPLNELPEFLGEVFAFNPLVYGVDGLRGALSGEYLMNSSLDVLLSVSLVLVMFVIGGWLFSRVKE